MKSKKSQFFMILLVIIAMAVLIAALFIINLQRPFDQTIGWRQATIIKAYQKAEKSLFYIDQSAKYAAYQTIYDLGQKGGLEESDCGSYLGYNFWVNVDSENKIKYCYPGIEDVKENFKSVFNNNLNKYIKRYNEISSETIPLNNYEYEFVDNLQILGKALKNIEIPILTEEQVELEIKQQEKIEETEHSYTKEVKEGFVAVKDVSCTGSCILKKEAYDKLLEANKIAKENGFELHIYSSYRSLEYQKDLWDGKTPENYAQRYPKPEERVNYVCNPYSPNPYQRCPHLTGGAVDIRIKGKTKSQMTSYDWERVANVMYEAGWVRYTPEEWHFEYGTERWARAQQAQVSEIV